MIWLKIAHIAAMAVWFTGLCFLPSLLGARARHIAAGTPDDEHFDAMTRALYFGVTTPAGVLTVTFGMILIAFGPFGAWLALKLVVVSVVVALHVYLGVVVHEHAQGRPRHGPVFLRFAGAAPLLLLLLLAALSAGKPSTVARLPPPPGLDASQSDASSPSSFTSDAASFGASDASRP